MILSDFEIKCRIWTKLCKIVGKYVWAYQWLTSIDAKDALEWRFSAIKSFQRCYYLKITWNSRNSLSVLWWTGFVFERLPPMKSVCFSLGIPAIQTNIKTSSSLLLKKFLYSVDVIKGQIYMYIILHQNMWPVKPIFVLISFVYSKYGR